MRSSSLSWFDIFRLGLVQTALGAIVVLTTSTMNRVMVVELALPAMLPGALVTWHHALQVLRPRWGHGSDSGGRRTPWIIGGMALLALGGAGSAIATAVMQTHTFVGIALAMLAFTLVGVGVGATGTSLLALLATSVAPQRRAAAATIVWMMMIAGFIVTTIAAGSFLDPFTTMRLIAVTSTVSAIAFVLGVVAIWGVEAKAPRVSQHGLDEEKVAFKQSLDQVWSEPHARRFTIFIFISMLAYSMQDLILEPYAGLVFDLTPGQSTKLSGLQNAGVFTGMLLIALAGHPRVGFLSLRTWVVAGCFGSAGALVAIVLSASIADVGALKLSVFALGLANGAYAVAAIGSMMALASSGRSRREGMRMGIWGASQALAFGLGGFFGTAAVDTIRTLVSQPVSAFAVVFLAEAALFLVAAALAVRAIAIEGDRQPRDASQDAVLAETSSWSRVENVHG